MQLPVATIVGGDTLLGRELRELMSQSELRPEVRLMTADEEGGSVLSEQDDEMLVISSLEEGNLAGASVVFLAGCSSSSRRALEVVSRDAGAPAIIDLTHGLEDHPKARLRAPVVEPLDFVAPPGAVHVIAHPAAIALALFYSRLHKRFPVKRSVVQVFEPASERGQRGIEELQQQTISLLSFKNVPKQVFDAQLSFNVLPRYGTEAPQKLEDIELRIDRHLATLLSVSGNMPMPSLRLLQAPVFHGYSCSVWAEFEDSPGEQPLAEALGSAQIEIRTADQEPPSNVGSAGQSGITVGALEADRNHPRAWWFWLVADNLRIVAENALEAARPLMEAATR